jgi:hypothetical protein
MMVTAMSLLTAALCSNYDPPKRLSYTFRNEFDDEFEDKLDEGTAACRKLRGVL